MHELDSFNFKNRNESDEPASLIIHLIEPQILPKIGWFNFTSLSKAETELMSKLT